jgi:hypothetical protein
MEEVTQDSQADTIDIKAQRKAYIEDRIDVMTAILRIQNDEMARNMKVISMFQKLVPFGMMLVRSAEDIEDATKRGEDGKPKVIPAGTWGQAPFALDQFLVGEPNWAYLANCLLSTQQGDKPFVVSTFAYQAIHSELVNLNLAIDGNKPTKAVEGRLKDLCTVQLERVGLTPKQFAVLMLDYSGHELNAEAIIEGWYTPSFPESWEYLQDIFDGDVPPEMKMGKFLISYMRTGTQARLVAIRAFIKKGDITFDRNYKVYRTKEYVSGLKRRQLKRDKTLAKKTFVQARSGASYLTAQSRGGIILES